MVHEFQGSVKLSYREPPTWATPGVLALSRKEASNLKNWLEDNGY